MFTKSSDMLNKNTLGVKKCKVTTSLIGDFLVLADIKALVARR